MGEKNMKWRVVLESDSETGDWAVWCPDLPGCVSAGETEEEALENIKEAITLYLEPNPIKLKSGAVLREVSVDGNNMNMLNIWCV
jgi:predicted RNase H-like HicB family nuclease